ncbi:DUF2550 family protein [Trueperella sp. LYQ141]|uniref:DUF2550 family protein n=1 Tax=Trueperella sp. LYQ141 TaxID=3391058 RepID=UPI003982D87F
MTVSDGIVAALCVFLGLVCVVLAGYVIRLRSLLRRPGAIQVAVRCSGERWRYGIGVMGGRHLVIFPRALRWSPLARWDRRGMSADRIGGEASIRFLSVHVDGQEYELACEQLAVEAILSWLESAAPESEPQFG